MTEPEIARRCPSCGASIRNLAFFCPQCGKQLAEQKSGSAQPSTSVITAPLVDVSPPTDAENAADPTPPVLQRAKDFSETIAEKPKDPGMEVPKFKDPQLKDPKVKDLATQPQQAPIARTAPAAGRARIQRTTTLARVEGDVVQRVQKLRKISTVVLDEAGYDPSLRFVLVAAFLLVLFLVIVLLNKFIG
ncbi:MAG: hypothetical protein ABR556_05325 [Pyrinomonadaceae bacterium]